MKKNLLFLAVLTLNFKLQTLNCFAQLITNHITIPYTNMAQPQVGVSYSDPKFHSSVTRITNAFSSNIEGAFPDYSKRQAWNSDESLLLLRSGNGDVLIYNGATYQYIKTFPGALQGVQDIFWHPTNPHLIYFISGSNFNTIDEQTLQINTLHTFSNYANVSTNAEGNMSNNGKYIGLCGYDSNWNPVDFFVYDVSLNSIISTLSVSANVTGFDWVSISPLGNYFVVDYADETLGRWHGVEVYDQQLNFLWQKPIGYGHSDLGLDSNGTEVLIMDKYNADSNLTYINKYGLADSSETSLLSVSPDFDLHESCRSMNRPGWVYVSTFDYVGKLTADSTTWVPFENEIFALSMNGSGSVQRLAHHHSRRYSPLTPNPGNSIYFAEPHATANKNGTKILFGSNWELNMQTDTSVDAYLCDASALLTAENFFTETNNAITVFPNPTSGKVNVQMSIPITIGIEDVQMKIYNVMGECIYQHISTSAHQHIDLSEAPNGIYFLQVSTIGGSASGGKTENGIVNKKIIISK
ncbi:MAG: T9SS type A sorting domain-containing protein [Bacteroidetes bacterium]|nr:T9SS type A sorting domain-containing protein [Bacteroidota bacterium]